MIDVVYVCAMAAPNSRRPSAPAEEALELQRPLADDSLMIVARGEKKDEGGLAA